MKYGLILEGGARRCIYAAGVTDRLSEAHISFDYLCGVSAGAQIAINYAAGQPERSKEIIFPQTKRESYHVQDILSCNLKRMAYEYPYRQIPLDFQAFFQTNTVCEIVATCCETAKPVYFTEHQSEKLLLDKLYASCCLPLIYPEIAINGKHYVDGSIADAIPYRRAFRMGCDKLVVILAKPADGKPTDYSKWKKLAEKKYRAAYPKLYNKLMHRAMEYEQQRKALLKRMKQDDSIFLFRPNESVVKPFEFSTKKLEYAYQAGYQEADRRMEELLAFLDCAEKTEATV